MKKSTLSTLAGVFGIILLFMGITALCLNYYHSLYRPTTFYTSPGGKYIAVCYGEDFYSVSPEYKVIWEEGEPRSEPLEGDCWELKRDQLLGGANFEVTWISENEVLITETRTNMKKTLYIGD